MLRRSPYMIRRSPKSTDFGRQQESPNSVCVVHIIRAACLPSVITILAYLLIIWGWQAPGALAAPLIQVVTPTPQPQSTPSQGGSLLSIADEVCLGCHGQSGLTMKLGDGSMLDLYIPAEMHQNSIHGKLGYACVQCHTTVGNYPHPSFSAQNTRDVTLQLYSVCRRCHNQQFELVLDSVHTRALGTGNTNAAVCVDCHTAHEVRQLTDPKTYERLPGTGVWTAETCGRCHSAIYDKYKDSVHGSALIGEGNPDVPTCIDCHGVHNIGDPTTAKFRLLSPEICAKCHTDPKRMGKYGISTEVLNTYVADFHGTTVQVFEKQSPDAPTNKPVCYDCHGVHDIARVDDPQKGLQIRENLLTRCQVCHPDANLKFPTAWLSHYIPSPSKNAMVYYVNLFYKILIPVVIGGMVLLVGMDYGRSSLNWIKRRRSSAQRARQVTESVAAEIKEAEATPVETASEVSTEIEISVEEASTIEAAAEISTTEIAEIKAVGKETLVEESVVEETSGEQTPATSQDTTSPTEFEETPDQPQTPQKDTADTETN
jgi:nitrate/TMAO reductase-like tetraheme cytochrome c subunit